MTVNQQRIRDVARDHRRFIDIELVKTFNDVDATTLRGVCRLNDPNVTLWLSLAKFCVVGVEVVEFVWQNVGVRNKIILISAKSLLHLDIVVAKSIFSRDLIALWEVIDALEFVQAFVQVAFARTRSPENVPLVRIREIKAVGFEDGSYQLRVTFQELVEHLAIVDMVAAARSLGRRGRLQQLRLCDRFNVYLLIERIYWRRVQVLRQIVDALLQVLVAFVEKILLCTTLPVVARRDE